MTVETNDNSSHDYNKRRKLNDSTYVTNANLTHQNGTIIKTFEIKQLKVHQRYVVKRGMKDIEVFKVPNCGDITTRISCEKINEVKLGKNNALRKQLKKLKKCRIVEDSEFEMSENKYV